MKERFLQLLTLPIEISIFITVMVLGLAATTYMEGLTHTLIVLGSMSALILILAGLALGFTTLSEWAHRKLQQIEKENK